MESEVDLGDNDTFIQSVCLSVNLFMVVERGKRQQMELEMDMPPLPFAVLTPLGLRKCSYFPALHVWLTRLSSLVTGRWGQMHL